MSVTTFSPTKNKNHGEAGRQSLATAATGPRNLENTDVTHSNALILEKNQRTTAGCHWVDLIAVLREGPDLVCRFYTPGGMSWKAYVAPADLQTFAAFQRKVATQLGLWVRHSSEQERTAKLQADDWKLAVECAWRKGS